MTVRSTDQRVRWLQMLEKLTTHPNCNAVGPLSAQPDGTQGEKLRKARETDPQPDRSAEAGSTP